MVNSDFSVTKSDEGFDIHQAVEFIEKIKYKIKNGDSLTEYEIEKVLRIYSRVYFDIIVPIADILVEMIDDIISMIEDELTSLLSVLDKELDHKITYADLIKANELKHSIDKITKDLNYKKKILAEARDYNKD